MTHREEGTGHRRLVGGWVLGLAWVAGCGGGAPPVRPVVPQDPRAAAPAQDGTRAATGDRAGDGSVREWLDKVRTFGADETSQQSSETCSLAADAIDEVGPPAVPTLAEALRSDPAWHVREFAAFALGRQGRHAVAAAPALLAGLKDENFLVTEACDGTLGTIAATGPAGLAAVVVGLDSDEAVIRGATAELLGAVGPAVADALPRLESLATGDPDASVRAAATEAVTAISGR